MRNDRVFDLHRAKFAGQIVRRILRPDALDGRNGLHRLAAAYAAVGIAEQLEIGKKPARPDAKHEAAAAHVIELRDLGGDDGGIVVRQTDHAGAEFQVFGARHETRHEHQRRRNRLRGRGKMLAQPHLVETERVGVKRLLFVLGQRVGERARWRMHRHHEYSEAHLICSGISRHPQIVMLREGGASSNRCGNGPSVTLFSTHSDYWIIRFRGW